jgi:hypothetical protein
LKGVKAKILLIPLCLLDLLGAPSFWPEPVNLPGNWPTNGLKEATTIVKQVKNTLAHYWECFG